jgi:hypothetical protein
MRAQGDPTCHHRAPLRLDSSRRTVCELTGLREQLFRYHAMHLLREAVEHNLN